MHKLIKNIQAHYQRTHKSADSNAKELEKERAFKDEVSAQKQT